MSLTVLGAGTNTFCALRRKRKTKDLDIKNIEVMSLINPLPINIRIDLDGRISVTKIGQLIPLLTYFDKNPLKIKYMSFASWGAAEAKWFYDCPTDGEFFSLF